jgi:hypothetical protein
MFKRVCFSKFFLVFAIATSPYSLSGFASKKPRSHDFVSSDTSTGRYLSHISWEMVISSLGLKPGEASDCKRLVRDLILPREKEFSSDYYVFYHAQKVEFSILYDLERYLSELFTEKTTEDFEFLRPESDYYACGGTADDFLKKHNYRINNRTPDMKKILLSVNLSFPGDLTYHSSSLYYYLRSKSSKAPLLWVSTENAITSFYPTIRDDNGGKELLSSIKSQIYDLENEFLEQRLYGQLEYGNVLQIFIPKHLVDQCVYFSKRGGSPRKLSIKESLYQQLKKTVVGQRFQKASTVLDSLNNNSESLCSELTGLQARILLHKDLFNDLNSGIKIFRYNQIPQGLSESYQSTLKSIAEGVFLLWKENFSDPLIANHEFLQKEIDEYFVQKEALFKTISEKFLSEDQ